MSRTRDAHDEPRARLREAAGAHEPDRARILARVERGMAGTRAGRPARGAPSLGWVRVVGATAAVAGILTVVGYAAASAVRDDGPARRTVAVSPNPDPSRDPTGRAPASPGPGRRSGTPAERDRPEPSRPGTPPGATATAVAGAPSGNAADGPLRSEGSVDPHSNAFWAQSDVTLRTGERLTALTVELRVRQTGGVSGTGSWGSLPEGDFTTTVTERDGFLVYTWVLRAGRTVWPGEWVFAGQYDHDRGGRDAGDDGYTVTATTTDGRRAAVAGDFTSGGADGGS
ncbi:hypothetical protein [Streptomyces sp. NPDC002580]|uniref:hypothetical protein n=1 Tax=Streptomyces sp. NPDC002580 TaxID=3364653 RepID=UPI0036BEFFD4